jgi:hypothetical protein
MNLTFVEAEISTRRNRRNTKLSSVPPDARIREGSAGEGRRPSREGRENASY